MSEISDVSLSEIRLNDYNPNTMDPSTFRSLLQDMRKGGPGVIDPILLRPLEGGGYEVVDGEHRVRAARRLGWKTIRARVQSLTLEEAMEVNYRKNRERGNLDPLKEGELFSWWQKEKGLTQRQIAEKFGITQSTVSRRIALIERLSPKIMPRGIKMDVSKLELLVSIDDEKARIELARKISDPEVSVRQAEEIVRQKHEELKLAEYQRRFEARRLEKKRRLEETGLIVVLEEELDWKRHRRDLPMEDGRLAPKCAACPKPAVMLRRGSTSEVKICADPVCWHDVKNEIYEREQRRREEEERRRLENQRRALEAPGEDWRRLLLFLLTTLSLEHPPGYLEDREFYDRWRPVEEMTLEEVDGWLRRIAVENLIKPVKPGSLIDVAQMLRWASERFGLDRDYLLQERGK